MEIHPKTIIMKFRDGILREILSYTFYLPDEAFTARTYESSFGNKSMPICYLLLVSKQWFRVATPLLYEFVLLRNTAQAEGFHETICGPSGKKLLGFVRRVRLDGHFGKVIKDIFEKLSPSIELFISSPLDQRDAIQGSCRNLHLLDPRKVIVDLQLETFGYICGSDFILALYRAIVYHWKSLTTLEIFVPNYTKREINSELRWLYSDMSKNPSLQRVIIKYETTEGNIYINPIAEELSKSNTIKALEIFVQKRDLIKDYNRDYTFIRVHYPETKKDTRNAIDPSRRCIPTSDAIYDDVYKRIIVLHLSSIGEGCEINERSKMQRKRLHELMSVSRDFKRLCLHIQHLDIRTPSSLNKYISDYKSAYGIVSRFSIGGTRIRKEEECHLLNLGLNHFTDVRRLEVPSDYVLFIPRITSSVFEKLEYLHLNCFSNREPCFTAISQIPSLRTLELTYLLPEEEKLQNSIYIKRKTIILANIRTVILRKGIPRLCLAHLLHCQFKNTDTLKIDTSERVYKGELEAPEEYKNLLQCFPNLLNLDITTFDKLPYFSANNRNVRKIIIEGLFTVIRERRTNDFNMSSKFMNFSGFPALKEIQITDVPEWPWTDHELVEYSWEHIIEDIEDLILKYNIKVTSKAGTAWRSRVQTRAHKYNSQVKKYRVYIGTD